MYLTPVAPMTTSKITLYAALTRYIEEISSAKSPTTRDQENRVAGGLMNRLDNLLLVELTPLILTEFRDRRLKEVSTNTVTRDLAFLDQVFQTAMKDWNVGLIGNPVSNVTVPMKVHGRGRRLKPGERSRLIAACERHINPMLGWVVAIILETGMRKAEILALTRNQVEQRGRVAHIPKMGTRGPRDVPLTRRAVKLFQEALKQAREVSDTELIFFGEPGQFGRRKPYAIDKVFRQALVRSRLKAFCLDDLRDDAIFRMLEAGLTQQEVSAITGQRILRIDRRASHLQVPALILRLDELEF